MSKHTPGPWKIGAPPPNGEQTIGTQQGLMVAVATTGAGVPTEANARLIATAPELLDELESAVLQMGMAAECVESGRHDEAILHLRSHVRQKRAVIAKARGEA